VPAEPIEAGDWTLHLRFPASSTTFCMAFTAASSREKRRGILDSRYPRSEATDARRAFPCWDEPDFKATFGITIIADESLTVLSNAHEISSGPLPGASAECSSLTP